jgi:hypothetical protein
MALRNLKHWLQCGAKPDAHESASPTQLTNEYHEVYRLCKRQWNDFLCECIRTGQTHRLILARAVLLTWGNKLDRLGKHICQNVGIVKILGRQKNKLEKIARDLSPDVTLNAIIQTVQHVQDIISEEPEK